jgi:hypothetical protein
VEHPSVVQVLAQHLREDEVIGVVAVRYRAAEVSLPGFDIVRRLGEFVGGDVDDDAVLREIPLLASHERVGAAAEFGDVLDALCLREIQNERLIT